jgi:hypothetical protein
MTWTKRNNEASYDYRSPDGTPLANVRMVGIKGRWRWSSQVHERLERNGWWGSKLTMEEAQACAEEYLKQKGLI